MLVGVLVVMVVVAVCSLCVVPALLLTVVVWLNAAPSTTVFLAPNTCDMAAWWLVYYTSHSQA